MRSEKGSWWAPERGEERVRRSREEGSMARAGWKITGRKITDTALGLNQLRF